MWMGFFCIFSQYKDNYSSKDNVIFSFCCLENGKPCEENNDRLSGWSQCLTETYLPKRNTVFYWTLRLWKEIVYPWTLFRVRTFGEIKLATEFILFLYFLTVSPSSKALGKLFYCAEYCHFLKLWFQYSNIGSSLSIVHCLFINVFLILCYSEVCQSYNLKNVLNVYEMYKNECLKYINKIRAQFLFIYYFHIDFLVSFFTAIM